MLEFIDFCAVGVEENFWYKQNWISRKYVENSASFERDKFIDMVIFQFFRNLLFDSFFLVQHNKFIG